MRSGRRWIDLADPAEEAALSTDYAALLRAFPCADRDVGSGGIVPLDRLIAAVRSVSATWAKHQQAAARFEIAAASDAPRARSARRGHPHRQRAASHDHAPFALLPPPPILPSLPVCGTVLGPWRGLGTVSSADGTRSEGRIVSPPVRSDRAWLDIGSDSAGASEDASESCPTADESAAAHDSDPGFPPERLDGAGALGAGGGSHHDVWAGAGPQGDSESDADWDDLAGRSLGADDAADGAGYWVGPVSPDWVGPE